ncbi:MAG: hypothetical protein ACFFED_13640 [Candidatus Thorarchaeota archaeon]
MRFNKILENAAVRKGYAIVCSLILSISIILLILGASGNHFIQSLAGICVLIGLLVSFGEIFLIINMVDKSNTLGYLLHRFAYSNLIAILFGYLVITITTYLSTFYIFGEASIHASGLISSIVITTYSSIGICLSYIAYHSLEDGTAWRTIASSI